MKVLPIDKNKEKVALLPDGQQLLLNRDETSGESLVKYRDILMDDPWYVRPEQRKLRDYPPRRWPPLENKEDSSMILPVDNTLWSDEYHKDLIHEAEYFVTNPHGGDLIINGMLVPFGAVAGPLPRFAIIETPGGQISWWHGVGGRDYVPGRSEGDFIWDESNTRKLKTLQDMGDEWKFTGMPAAQVWDLKMNDRAAKERKGNNEEDDEEWECWKNGLHYCGYGYEGRRGHSRTSEATSKRIYDYKQLTLT